MTYDDWKADGADNYWVHEETSPPTKAEPPSTSYFGLLGPTDAINYDLCVVCGHWVDQHGRYGCEVSECGCVQFETDGHA